MSRERSKMGVVLILPFLLLKILFILHDVVVAFAIGIFASLSDD